MQIPSRSSAVTLVIWLCSLLAIVISIWLARTGHSPPVGVYIAFMGLAAALATFRGGILSTEKGAWIVLITILMIAEVRNLYVADADQIDRFKKISEALALTSDGLDRTAAKLDVVNTNSQAYYRESKGQFADFTKGLSILREEDRRRTEQLQQLQLSSVSAEQLGNLARELAVQMKNYRDSYSYNDSQIDLVYYDALEGPGQRWTRQQQNDWIAEEGRKRLDLQKSYEAQALKLIAEANQIRGEMVRRLAFSPGAHTNRDDIEARWFADPSSEKKKAGFLFLLGEKATYLEELASRLLSAQQ